MSLFGKTINVVTRVLSVFLVLGSGFIAVVLVDNARTYGWQKVHWFIAVCLAIMLPMGIGFATGGIGRVAQPGEAKRVGILEQMLALVWFFRVGYGVLLLGAIVLWNGWLWLCEIFAAAIVFEVFVRVWRRMQLRSREAAKESS